MGFVGPNEQVQCAMRQCNKQHETMQWQHEMNNCNETCNEQCNNKHAMHTCKAQHAMKHAMQQKAMINTMNTCNGPNQLTHDNKTQWRNAKKNCNETTRRKRAMNKGNEINNEHMQTNYEQKHAKHTIKKHAMKTCNEK